MSEVFAKISIGELLDKLSILEIKKNEIKNQQKLKYVEDEYDTLYLLSSNFLLDLNIKHFYTELSIINKKLWDIEEKIRKKERDKVFDLDFIETARDVYKTNDRRFEIKNEINKLTNSKIKEQKNYNND
jgi:hypothetical protein